MQTSISVAGDYGELIPIELLESNPDLLICIKYLLLKDSEPKLSMEQITEMLHSEFPAFPTTRIALYNRIDKWKEDGTFRIAEQLYLTPKIEEYRAAVGRVITALPNIIDRLIDEAKTGKSGKNALDITNFLIELSRGEMNKVQEPGDVERKFIRTPKSHNPMDIVTD